VCGGRTRVAGGRNRAAAYVGAECCHIRRNARAVDEHISRWAVGVLSRPDAAGLLRPPPRPDVDARRLRAEARKLRQRKQAQVQMHAEGALDDADLAAGARHIRKRLAEIDAQLAASDQPDPLAEFRGQPAAGVWAGLGMARKRAVVQSLCAGIVIHRAGRRGQGFDPGTLEIAKVAGV
jgi:hypothetical protein